MGLGSVEVTAKNIVKSVLLMVGDKESIEELITNRKHPGTMKLLFPMSLQDPTYKICKDIEKKDNGIDNINIGQSVEKCHCYLLMGDLQTSNVLIGVEGSEGNYTLTFPSEECLSEGDDLLIAAIHGFHEKTGIELTKQQQEDIELFSLVGVDMDTIIFICRLDEV